MIFKNLIKIIGFIAEPSILCLPILQMWYSKGFSSWVFSVLWNALPLKDTKAKEQERKWHKIFSFIRSGFSNMCLCLCSLDNRCCCLSRKLQKKTRTGICRFVYFYFGFGTERKTKRKFQNIRCRLSGSVSQPRNTYTRSACAILMASSLSRLWPKNIFINHVCKTSSTHLKPNLIYIQNYKITMKHLNY